MARDSDSPIDATEEIKALVEDDPVLSALNGEIAIIEAPEWATDADHLLADSDGRFFPVWPEENSEYVSLLEAFQHKLQFH